MPDTTQTIDWKSLRNVELVSVVQFFGAERHAYDKKKWITSVGPISINEDKNLFHNHHEEQGGKGAINLWCHLSNLDPDNRQDVLQAAREMQKEGFGGHGGTTERNTRIARTQPKKSTTKPLMLPEPVESKWPAAFRYLNEERCIPRTVIDPLHASGRLFAGGRYGNVTWLLGWTDGKVYGADLKGVRTNRDGQRFGGVCEGTNRSKSFFLIAARERTEPEKRSVVILEATIDAMSYAALHPHATVISLGGCSNYTGTVELLKQIVPTGVPLFHGFDHDKAGMESDYRLREHYKEATGQDLEIGWDWPEPFGSDWNEVLKQIVSPLPASMPEHERMAHIEAQGEMLRMRRDSLNLGRPPEYDKTIERMLEKRDGRGRSAQSPSP